MAQMQIGLGQYTLDNVPKDIESGTNSKYGAVMAIHFVSDKPLTGTSAISYSNGQTKTISGGSNGTISGTNIPKTGTGAIGAEPNLYRDTLTGTNSTSNTITNFLVGSSGSGTDSVIYKIDNNAEVGWREKSGSNVLPSYDSNAKAIDGTNVNHYLFVGPIPEKGGVGGKPGINNVSISNSESNNLAIVGTRRIVVKRICWDGTTFYETIISDNYYPIGTSGIFDNRYNC